MELTIQFDLFCNSNSLKNATKKFNKSKLPVIEVLHSTQTNYFAECVYYMTSDECKHLGITGENFKNFDFYKYFTNLIPLEYLRTRKNKTGIFVDFVSAYLQN
jgi:hypothetical protein